MKSLLQKSLMVLALLGSFSQVSASQSYIYQNATLKAKDGKTAKVFVGVPVEVKKELGKEINILVKGYQFNNEIYSTKDKNLLIAKLEKGFKVNKNGEQVEILGNISKELLSKDPSDIWAEHEEFYFEMCTQCHKAPEIKHHTMNEWSALFESMKGFAKLDEEESSYLLRYLKSNASDGLVKTKNHK